MRSIDITLVICNDPEPLGRSVEQCHYTYITKYRASQEEVCDENYEKVCQITYVSTPVNDTVRKCYTPVEKGG